MVAYNSIKALTTNLISMFGRDAGFDLVILNLRKVDILKGILNSVW